MSSVPLTPIEVELRRALVHQLCPETLLPKPGSQYQPPDFVAPDEISADGYPVKFEDLWSVMQRHGNCNLSKAAAYLKWSKVASAA